VPASLTFLKTYLRPHRRSIALLALILAATIAIQISTTLIAARFIDDATSSGSHQRLVLLALATIALALTGQGLAIVETWVAERVSWSATNALRLDLASHILRLDYTFHAAHSQGALIERVDGDVGTLARFFSRFVVNVVGSGILIVGILGVLWTVDWQIGLVITIFMVIALVVMGRIRSAATPEWARQRQASADFYGFLSEYLAGLEDVRSSGARSFVLRRFALLMRAWLPVTTRAGMWGYALIATSQGIFLLGTAAALAMSIARFSEGSLTLGAVFLAVRLTDMLGEPTEQLRDEVQDFQQADASLARVRDLLAERPHIVDGPGTPLPAGALSVEFDSVSFGYQQDSPILKDISVRVEPGRVLGIVGRTGSGKSTLARLIPRLLDPDSGMVRVGQVDVRETTLAALRGRIGIVSQETQLFDASLRDNLTMFADRIDEDDGRLIDLLDVLGLGPWFKQLPRGLDTPLGDGGTGLSAGQLQVLCCARILLTNPDLVILDEASARLDVATERLVHDALKTLMASRTGIIIAHRLDTLAFADDIAVLVDGELREHGPREVLAADPTSHFASLLRLDLQEPAQ
jgi:ABC-type multidrug transport system fused ATPase/permease subunit